MIYKLLSFIILLTITYGADQDEAPGVNHLKRLPNLALLEICSFIPPVHLTTLRLVSPWFAKLLPMLTPVSIIRLTNLHSIDSLAIVGDRFIAGDPNAVGRVFEIDPDGSSHEVPMIPECAYEVFPYNDNGALCFSYDRKTGYITGYNEYSIPNGTIPARTIDALVNGGRIFYLSNQDDHLSLSVTRSADTKTYEDTATYPDAERGGILCPYMDNGVVSVTFNIIGEALLRISIIDDNGELQNATIPIYVYERYSKKGNLIAAVHPSGKYLVVSQCRQIDGLAAKHSGHNPLTIFKVDTTDNFTIQQISYDTQQPLYRGWGNISAMAFSPLGNHLFLSNCRMIRRGQTIYADGENTMNSFKIEAGNKPTLHMVSTSPMRKWYYAGAIATQGNRVCVALNALRGDTPSTLVEFAFPPTEQPNSTITAAISSTTRILEEAAAAY